MNKEEFQKLLEIYKSKFESFNQPDGRHEIFKWSAVQTCQNNWNLDSEDFLTMFKEAMSQTSFIIENSTIHPINGIVFLCENGKTEEVREEFRKLLEDDKGDIKARQKRIESFRDNINAMLSEIDSRKWSFCQTYREPIMFLSFIKPEENYMFKASPAKDFADYMDFGGDIGAGQSFHLSEYYRLCDEVLEEIPNDAELIKLIDDELEKEAATYNFDLQKFINNSWKLRVLVYDIMYVANTTGFYTGFPVPAKRKSRGSSITEKERIKKKRIEELHNLLDSKGNELEEIKGKIPPLPNLTGMELNNIKSGKGKVILQEENYVTVEFAKDTRTFSLPGCLSKGFLTGADPDTVELCKQISELGAIKKALTDEISRYCTELSLYE
ncbi:hypothetical protein SAMN04487760_1164 [Lachnospiraceae bacterium G41]|nr:hypothetical protein SAMN04487760_1164 [Lachnospiraceae bacterium G41]